MNSKLLYKEKKLASKVREISAKYSGILTDDIKYYEGSSFDSRLNLVVAEMPNYEKLVSKDFIASYHLSGYGRDLNDSMNRLLGESIERYASIASIKYLKSRLFYKKYSDVTDSKSDLIYLSPYMPKQEKELNYLRFRQERCNRLRKDQKVCWVRAKSLFNPTKSVAVPASHFFVGCTEYSCNFPSVSTGTATYTDFNSALYNALIEYIQIDAYQRGWYSQESIPAFDISDLPSNITKDAINLLGNLLKKYRVLVTDYSKFAVSDIYVFGIFLISRSGKNVPAISFGLQGGTNIANALFRGLAEAIADLETCRMSLIDNPVFANVDRRKIVNLDDNVTYFANPANFQENVEYINSRVSKVENIKVRDHKPNIRKLIDDIKNVSSSACFLDITPPFIENYRVIRLFIPELLSISFPSFPQMNHPRFIGLRNEDYYISALP